MISDVIKLRGAEEIIKYDTTVKVIGKYERSEITPYFLDNIVALNSVKSHFPRKVHHYIIYNEKKSKVTADVSMENYENITVGTELPATITEYKLENSHIRTYTSVDSLEVNESILATIYILLLNY
jgi:hypothetical protein